MDNTSLTAFRRAEKRVKGLLKPATDLPAALRSTCVNEELFDVKQTVNGVAVWRSTRRPGVVLVRGYIGPGEDVEWVKRSVLEYTSMANPSNLDPQYPDLAASAATTTSLLQPVAPLSRWDRATRDVFAKLRWVTLGMHYDWTAKVYPEHKRGAFPAELAELSKRIAGLCQYNADYKAEAAIVNYYHVGDSLAGHTDNSEENHMAPLISVSLGLSAVFLLGGLTRDVEPDAILLEHGDVIVMHDDARLSYHGRPLLCGKRYNDLPFS